MSWLLGILAPLGKWLVQILITDVVNWLQLLWSKRQKEDAQKTQEADQTQKYEDVINKPDVTREEQSNAEDKLINHK